MKFRSFFSVLGCLFLGILVASVGCSKEEKKEMGPQAKGTSEPKNTKAEKKDDDSEPHGWWCKFHGVPEQMCSLCNAEIAAQSKKTGDWCKLHDRAKSQCFKCDPALYKKYEDMYVAKFGQKPERPPQEEFEK